VLDVATSLSAVKTGAWIAVVVVAASRMGKMDAKLQKIVTAGE
jgi:hypothetical protein